MPAKATGFGANPAFGGGGGGGGGGVKKMDKQGGSLSMDSGGGGDEGGSCFSLKCFCNVWTALLVICWLGSGILGLYYQFKQRDPDYLISIALLLTLVALLILTMYFCVSSRSDDEDDGRFKPERVAAWFGYLLITAAVVFMTLKVIYAEKAYSGPERCRVHSQGKGFYRYVDNTCYTAECPDGECAVFQHGFSGCATNCFTSSDKITNLTANKGIIQHFTSASNDNVALRQFNFTAPVGYTREGTGFKAAASILTKNVSSSYTGTLSYSPCAAGANCSTTFNTAWLDTAGSSVAYIRTCATSGTLLSSQTERDGANGGGVLSPDHLLQKDSALLAGNETCDGPAKTGPWTFTVTFVPEIAETDAIHIFLKLISDDPDASVDVSEVLNDADAYTLS